MPRQPAPLPHLDVDSEVGRQPTDESDRVGPVGRTRLAPPAGPLPLTGQHDRQVERLDGQCVDKLLHVGLVRSAVDAVDRRRARGPTGNATVPVSNSATPAAPRPMLRPAALRTPGSNVVV